MSSNNTAAINLEAVRIQIGTGSTLSEVYALRLFKSNLLSVGRRSVHVDMHHPG